MAKENLIKKLGGTLKRKVMPYFMAGALLYTTFSSLKCGDDYVKPDPKNPVATFTANPTEGEAPLEVRFNASQSYAREGSLEKYLWDFNRDGITDATTSEAYINYIYEQAGEYYASLVVKDSQGRLSTNTALKKIVVRVVEQKKPVAMFFVDPTGGEAPLEVSFTSLSYALEGELEEHRWDFDGDGETDEITSGVSGAYTSHVYGVGEHDPILVVEDSQGQISPETKLLEKIVVIEDIVTLGRIAFLNQNRDNPDRYEDDIYSGNIVLRVKDNNIELRNIERLTTDPRQDFQPAWSPDGKYLAWITNRGDPGFNSIYVMEEDGADKRKLTPPINMSFWRPSWSPDGTEIAFGYIDRDLSTNGIGKINIDGSGLTKLIENQGEGTLPSGSWSNDGRIFYHDYVSGNWDIYTINSDGSGLPERITNTPYSESLPSVSPVGDRLIFLSDQFGSSDIFSAKLDGTNVERITTDPGVETDPAWSPDGTQIIFAYDAPLLFNPQLYLVNSDGTGDWTQFTFDWANRHPAWKPPKIEDLNFN